MPEGLGYAFGALGGLGLALHELDRQRRQNLKDEMALVKDTGTFVPVGQGEQPARSFLERLLGTGVPPEYYDLGNGKMYRLERYPELGESGARALDLTYPETRTVAPMQPLTPFLADSPAAPLFAQGLPTPSTVTQEQVLPGAADWRLAPKERLEILKEKARQRRDQAMAAAMAERTKLWLQRTPASVAKYQWLRDGLNSDDPDIQEIARIELSRMEAPGRRVDLGEDRLDQVYKMHRERLQTAVDQLDKRLQAAKERNDSRTQAALERQRERFLERLDEIDLLEKGRDYRAELGGEVKREIAGAPGTRAGAVQDMKTDDALAKIKECRTKLHLTGTSSQAFARLEQLVTQLKQQERSHVGPTITRQLRRLGDQLDRAERREGVRPQTPHSPTPGPGRQSSSIRSTTPPAASSQSDQPTPQMLAAYQRYYEGMSPDEAELDLKTEMTQDRLLQERGIPAPRTLAKQQAFSRLFPDRPLNLRLPAPDAPAPAASAVPQPTPPVPQGRPTPAAPPTPQAQAVMQRLRQYYAGLSDADLHREAARLTKDDTGLDVLTGYRRQALDQVRQARQQAGAAAPPAVPEAPATAAPQQVINYLRGQYQNYSTEQLLAEARRLHGSDPLEHRSSIHAACCCGSIRCANTCKL